MTSTNTTTTTTIESAIQKYGVFILSMLALVLISIAWLLHDVDQSTAIATIGAILAGNGLVSATQWQTAPGLLGAAQAIIGQLTAHIQALHAQQLSQASAPATTSASTPTLAPAVTSGG